MNMKTSKHSFSYLCFIFIFAFLHFHMERLNVILSFIFLCACAFLAANYTGYAKACKKPLNLAIIIISSFLFACALPFVERFIFSLCRTGDFRIQAFASIPALVLCVIASLFLCKLFYFGHKIVFPRWAFLILCFIPPFVYMILGIFLSLIDVSALELALNNFTTIYSGKIVLLYNFELYPPMRDITIGWSIFCMMKYNQSMRIKALLEMQLANMTENT